MTAQLKPNYLIRILFLLLVRSNIFTISTKKTTTFQSRSTCVLRISLLLSRNHSCCHVVLFCKRRHASSHSFFPWLPFVAKIKPSTSLCQRNRLWLSDIPTRDSERREMHSGNQMLADSKVAGITLHVLHKLFLSEGRRTSGTDRRLWFFSVYGQTVCTLLVWQVVNKLSEGYNSSIFRE